ncbi:19643_t:CDS:2 [Entrophospora sp. SA101]|nr:19643_t:CDS:2 [Entrophospora sp. SA101]
MVDTDAYFINFDVIEEVNGKSFKFYHFHKEGIGWTLSDLDAAHAKFLGLALHHLDSEKDWKTRLIYVFKLILIFGWIWK